MTGAHAQDHLGPFTTTHSTQVGNLTKIQELILMEEVRCRVLTIPGGKPTSVFGWLRQTLMKRPSQHWLQWQKITSLRPTKSIEAADRAAKPQQRVGGIRRQAGR
jgi:hypothetical protein